MSPAPAARDRRDTPFGWITDIPPNLPINKGTACGMYLLDYRDLGDREDVWYDDRIIGARYYCKEYKERDVEWKAWEIHGGPIGYWHFLKKESQEKRLRSNLLPYGYRRGARYDLSLPAPPALQDRYVCDSIVLRDAKRALPSWIWDTCNEVLDGVFLDGGIPLSAKDLTHDREDAMKLAVSFFQGRRQLYAGRPDQPLGPSPCMKLLRQVLSEAPTPPKPGSKAWGASKPGLDFSRSGTLEFYVWDADYRVRVLDAMRGVIEELGLSAAGWASARWEVYDKYSQLPSFALRYDRKERRWHDDAAAWLADKLASQVLQDNARGQSSAGNASNKPLPGSSSSSTTSPQRPSEAGSSAASPVRSPSAGARTSP